MNCIARHAGNVQRMQQIKCPACRTALSHLLTPELRKLALPVTPLTLEHTVRYAHFDSSKQNKGQELLEYWQSLLGKLDHSHAQPATGKQTGWQTEAEDIRDLLHAAIRVRQGRVSGVLPEQLMSTFVQVYEKAMGSKDRLKLFQLLCQDFGVQGK